MKKIYNFTAILLISLFAFEASGQIYKDGRWWTVLPGTVSHRKDGSATPEVDATKWFLGTHYGSDEGGLKTNWGNSSAYTSNGRTSGYEDIALFSKIGQTGVRASDMLAGGELPTWAVPAFRMNGRLASPYEYRTAPVPGKKYPIVIMMHGVGETANCRGRCNTATNPEQYNNDHNLYHGGREHLEAINADPGDPKHWPGFVLFPQVYGAWGYSYDDGEVSQQNLQVQQVARMVEVLITMYPIDPNRIYIHGLSNGGAGTHLFVYDHPDLIAAAGPMSGALSHGYEGDYGFNEFGAPNDYPPEETMVHIPIWQFQGGQDKNPTPTRTLNSLQQIYDAGGYIRYYEYPNFGHNVWWYAYNREPDFFSWFQQYSKLSIHNFFGITEICEGSSAKLGITGGYVSYQWQLSTDGGSSWSSFPSIPGRPHEIMADQAGLYRVKFTRNKYIPNTSNIYTWSQSIVQEETPWSEPFEMQLRPRSKPVIQTNGSWVLWGLNNNTSLTLTADNTTAANYTWYKNGAVFATGNNASSITLGANDEGVYTLQYDENNCTSLLSDPVYINRAPTDGGEPAAPSDMDGTATSISTTTIWWKDNAINEIGYEIYRSLDGVNYTWLGNFPADKVTYDDTNLPAGQSIFYKVRAFNENGASSEATVEVVMPADNNAPAIPGNFSFERFRIQEFRLNPEPFLRGDDPITMYDEHFLVHLDSGVFSWDPVSESTDIFYDIYASNGTLIGSTQDTSYVVPGLEENESYSFYVKSRDINGLESGQSQQAAVFTVLNGLYYKYYQGAIWDVIKDYSFHEETETGPIHNFLIDAIPEHDFPDYFAYDFIGFINIQDPGVWEFRTRSDDGSSLWIGDVEVVDNDGLHGAQNATGLYSFPEAGVYPITVKYFERTGGNSLAVTWRKQGTSQWTSIPDNILTSATTEPPAPPTAPVNLSASADGYSVDLSWNHENESMKVVVLGSSTANGTGASSYANSWFGKFQQALEDLNPANEAVKLVQNGFTSYHILPDGTNTPGNRPDPDESKNISAALDLNPDIVIVNLPSNDRANGYNLETETLDNFLTVKAAADAAGVEIYFTTTQPRNLIDLGDRQLLSQEATRIKQLFGAYAINIYDELVQLPGYTLKAGYDSGDGTHLNDAGHNYLYQTIWNKVSEQSIPRFEVFRSEAGGSYVMALTTNKQQVSITDPDLMASTFYEYKVRAVTTAGASAFSNVANATTAGDTEPPTIPQNFREAATSQTEVTVVWDASTDNVAVEKYVVVETSGGAGGRTGSVSGKTMMVMGETSLTSMTLTGLTPLETLTLAVKAVDPSGNESPLSNEITVQTQAPLPVEFLDVSHRITDDGVLVTWATASELNNAYFTVERGTGLNDFEAIGGVDGSGTTTSRRDYVFLDTEPLDLAYYRIKQTDFDGKYEYSKIIRVVYDDANLEEFTVYPNPTIQENINARGYVPTSRPEVQVKLVDVMGKVHMQKVLDPNAFLNGVKIDLDYAVPPGVYIIQISDGANNTQRRVVIR